MTEQDRENIAADSAELEALGKLMDALPDELATPRRSGKAAAAEFRLRMWVALRAMGQLLELVHAHPVGVSRAALAGPLARWRGERAKIAQRFGRIGGRSCG